MAAVNRQREKLQLVTAHAAAIEDIAKRLHLTSKGAKLRQDKGPLLDELELLRDLTALMARVGAVTTILMED